MEQLGVYIHWPYCLSKCPYCAFFSRVDKKVDEEEKIAEYLADLEYYRSLNDNYEVRSISFGGGTPSLISPDNIEKIINKVCVLWKCADKLEISLEANPNSDHKNMFADLRSAGVNRLSLGVQSLNEKYLKFFGRTHSLDAARTAIDSVLQNFDNHSMDLISARPEQDITEWEQELQQAVSLGFKHLSVYQLSIDEGTAFAKKGIKELSAEAAAEQYLLSKDTLEQAGYKQYEISNFAQAGFESLHNKGYWQGLDYVGVGKGAAGRIHSKNCIFETEHSRKLTQISNAERAMELLFMGLRQNDGIDKQLFFSQCGIEFLETVDAKNLHHLKKEGLVIENEQFIKTTEKGQLLLDFVIEKLAL